MLADRQGRLKVERSRVPPRIYESPLFTRNHVSRSRACARVVPSMPFERSGAQHNDFRLVRVRNAAAHGPKQHS